MITIVMPYYDNGGMLERHFEEWQSYSPEVKKHFRAVIVDDGSPNDPARDHWHDPGFPCELYRIKEDLVWNVAGARNLGMHAAPEGWCLLTDIDHLLTRYNALRLACAVNSFGTADYFLLGREWADGRLLHPHPNTYVLQRSLYWRVGGCDEDWTGYWGAGEQVFRKTIACIANSTTLESIRLTHYGRDDIADASTRVWGRRGSEYDWRNNAKLVKKAQMAPYKPENPLRFTWERVV